MNDDGFRRIFTVPLFPTIISDSCFFKNDIMPTLFSKSKLETGSSMTTNFSVEYK